MVAPLYTTDSGLLFHAGKILVCTVGLPARGKTHISRALERYLRWTGVKTQVISLGDYRRKVLGSAQNLPPDYFMLEQSGKSHQTVELRQKILEGCEQLIWDFFNSGGQVVIYDANNGTREKRQEIAEKADKKKIHIVFLESICDNEDIILSNIRGVKISSPDYKGWNSEKAIEDYYRRIRDHEKHYEPVDEDKWPSIRIMNVGERIMVNQIRGYLQSRIVFFLMNIHNRFRTIYFARSGQSLIEHSYKADSDLSPAGWEYAEKLKEFVLERRQKSLEQRGIDGSDRRLVIWTSARRRSHHTAWPFLTTVTSSLPFPIAHSHSTASLSTLAKTSILAPSADPQLINFRSEMPTPHDHTHDHKHHETLEPGRRKDSITSQGSSHGPSSHHLHYPRVKVIEKPQMSEINPGVWDGMTPEQVRKYFPDEWERFVRDPYAYRAPRAESYHDLCVRLEPILIELEREREDLLIIGHASVIRCILAYLIGLPQSEIPAIEVARGDLIEVVPTSYGVTSTAFHFWDGPGRKGDEGQGGKDESNFYENYAEDTRGKRKTDVAV
ncbi:bifunctional 6-phosphofructo-2-kinase/fructose-2,6-bisphosphate 2-phosphatase [Irpex rosettiformis]|uniref:Bifunctional 6-phosphofructo-2-kinase/fructose-2,6-bisphosphate 2-phosphatase n=1 Tax=Irpex rosettiformis TaxID=378272 RepID=A0ACB8U7W1_9APHY|nr:bifunctional 6-phosphofructo-2-kinase/fructose-2,6-bisphosphate 2-phosphatase [Irpex rosettiformis]